MSRSGAIFRSVCACIPRAWWAILVIVHVPIVITVWTSILTDGADLSRVGSGILLILCMAFFVLKFQDVWFLRLRTRQQSLVAVCLLIAVFHHGAAGPGIDQTIAIPATVVVATLTIGGLVRHRRTLSRLGQHVLDALRCVPAPVINVRAFRARVEHRPPFERPFVISQSVPRAPPA
ncbi:MAG: hypothetical protein GY715_09755 [Planctomycetes bacterium]|nr:hypothetical protein [Planctomycetota bacterium]